MKQIKLLALNLLLVVFALVFAPAITANATEEESETDYSDQYVVLSLEGFTLGQGYYIEPTKMSYEEIAAVWAKEDVEIDLDNLTAAQATYAFFVNAGLETEYTGGGYSASDFYLANVKDIDKGEVNVPECITSAYKKYHETDLAITTNTDNDLGEYDYTSMSGWMISVDNEFINVGAGSFILEPESTSHTYVIRWQFTLADYGGDLGCPLYDSSWNITDNYYFETADKSALYIYYAENKDTLTEDVKAEVLEVLTKLDATADEVAAATELITPHTVTITGNSGVPTFTLKNEDGTEVNIGDPTSYVYTASLVAGTYTLTGYGTQGVECGSIQIEVTDEDDQSFKVWTLTKIYATNSNWTLDDDYTIDIKVVSKTNEDRHATAGTSNYSGGGASCICLNGDTIKITGTPIGDYADSYAPQVTTKTMTANTTCTFAITVAIHVNVNAPTGSTVQLGNMTNYYVYSYYDLTANESDTDGYDSYTAYKLASGSSNVYFLRVTHPDGVTYWKWFTASASTTITVTADELFIDNANFTSSTILDDYSLNPYDTGDIFLTANEQGYISLETGDTYTLEAFRNWLAIEGTGNSQMSSPDFHFLVIDENGNASTDVITVTQDENTSGIATITAVGQGTAIILVTYDSMYALTTATTAMGLYYHFSAIWPENTGVVVVTVDEDGTSIETGMTLNDDQDIATYQANRLAGTSIDAEIDVLYYDVDTEDGASYTFAPEEGVKVSVLHPVLTTNSITYDGFTTDDVTANEDGTYTVSKLTTGANIIKVTKGDVSTYQVVRAKGVTVSYTYTDANGNEISEEELSAGCSITVTYATIQHPANKMSGIYNMYAYAKLTDSQGTVFTGGTNQYAFASTAAAQTVTLTIPTYYEEETYSYTGRMYASGYGSSYGSHRYITYELGKPADFTAVTCASYFGSLPSKTWTLAKSYYPTVTVNVEDSETENTISDYTITITGSDGEAVEFEEDGTFTALAGMEYSYEISASGYYYATGSFTVDKEAESTFATTIKLDPLAEGAWDGVTATEPSTNEDGTYLISTGEELYWFACQVNSGNSTISAILTADIDLATFAWTPIGTTSTYKFAGTFDGAGYTISNLRVSRTASYSGLFGYVVGGTIKDLIVKGSVTSTNTYTAGIAAYAAAGSLISGCVSYVDVTYAGTSSSFVYIGGIAGALAASTTAHTEITDCINYGTVNSGTGTYAGGIVGSVAAVNITVTNSTNYGSVLGNNYVGGIIGNLKVTTTSTTSPLSYVTYCYNAGNVTSTGAYVGGIAGYTYGSSSTVCQPVLAYCFNAGTVSAANSGDTKAIYGYTHATYLVNIHDNYYLGDDEEESLEDQATLVATEDFQALLSEDADENLVSEYVDFVKAYVTYSLSDDEAQIASVLASLIPYTVYVSVYDYVAVAAGIDGASETGVILDSYEVAATNAVSAIIAAFDANDIAYTYSDSWGSAYFSGINGLDTQEDYYLSGWYFSFDGDDFETWGASYVTIEDGSTIEFHYGLTGTDIAYAGYGLPILETLVVGDVTTTFAATTDYDENWNAVTTYTMNDEEITGSGTEEDPFVVSLTFDEDTDVTALAVACTTVANENYVTVCGLDETIDLTDAVTFYVVSRGGYKAYYTVSGTVEIADDDDDDDDDGESGGGSDPDDGTSGGETTTEATTEDSTTEATTEATTEVSTTEATTEDSTNTSVTSTSVSTSETTEASTSTTVTKPGKVKKVKVKSKKKKKATVTWKKVSGASGYQIVYSISKKFTKSKTKSVTVKGGSKKTKTLKKLKSGKTYYVKVRAYKVVNGKKVYGKYSKVKKVRVK